MRIPPKFTVVRTTLERVVFQLAFHFEAILRSAGQTPVSIPLVALTVVIGIGDSPASK